MENIFEVLKDNIFIHETIRMEAPQLLGYIENRRYVFWEENPKKYTLEETVFKVMNNLPINIKLVYLRELDEYYIIEGTEEVKNLLTFFRSKVSVKIGDITYFYEDRPGPNYTAALCERNAIKIERIEIFNKVKDRKALLDSLVKIL